MLAVTDPDGPRGRNITAFVVEKVGPGLLVRPAGAQARHQGQPDLRAAASTRSAIPGDRVVGDVGEG